MTNKINELMRLATALPAASCGSNANYIEAVERLRTALDAALKTEKAMRITDDHGQATQPQYRVIETRGNWQLLYDQHQIGNTVCHEFRIVKLRHNIILYRGITLEEALKRFDEKVEADHE